MARAVSLGKLRVALASKKMASISAKRAASLARAPSWQIFTRSIM
jgi:hypothetical protein